MILRKVSIKDYTKINNLFKRNNMKMIPFKYWTKLWQKNPILKNKKEYTKGWIIEREKKVIGHFGSFPTKYLLNNKSYICSVIHNWVVDKKFRYQSNNF